MKKVKSLSTYLLALMLVFSLSACGGSAQTPPQPDSGSAIHNGDTLGTGAVSFTVEVVDADKQQTTFTVQTDEQTVGAALQKLGVVEGEDSQYGLYIKTVNGITADYDKDGTYWAFYIDGQYAQTGADMTAVTAGSVYRFAIERMQ